MCYNANVKFSSFLSKNFKTGKNSKELLMKIGVVLAGGMNNGIYEIGCLKAIAESFSSDDIACISASSIGSLVAYAFSSGQTELLINTLKDIDIKKSGRFFLSFSKNSELLSSIRSSVAEDFSLRYPTYVTVWNYTKRKVEYISLHTLSQEQMQNYLCASIAVPFFNKGVRINGNTHFDGAIVDNVPVYPLLKQSVDVVFCIYFDEKNYFFENEDFDKKVVKLCKFPRQKRCDNFYFDPERVDSMIDYGYCYTKNIISDFLSNCAPENIYDTVKNLNASNGTNARYRITEDSIAAKLNKVTSKFSKREIL